VPFFWLSVHFGDWHVPLVHTLLWQSVARVQGLPLWHGEQVPPQSTPVSEPFFTPSLQPGVWQTPPDEQ
jgi:hypothetical protein